MRYRDSNLFRFFVFVFIPLFIIIKSGLDSGSYYTGLINLLGINIILVVSLNLVNGFTGMFSMGHAAFMAIGAYVSAFLTLSVEQKIVSMPGLPDWLMNLNLPFPIALVFASLFASVVALLIGFPVLRFKGHYLSVATIGLIVIIRSVLDNEDELTNGARGVTGLPNHASTWIIFFIAIVCLFILYKLIGSAYGRGLVAMRDDDVAAQSLGINLTVNKISAFCISAFMAGVAGGLWGHMQSVISGKFFYINESFKIVQTSIIGGMYSLSGSIVGSLVMTFIPEFLAPFENGFKIFDLQLPELYGISNVILAILLIVVILFRRKGMMGYSEIIVETLFSRETYASIFKRSEYSKLYLISKGKILQLARKSKSIYASSSEELEEGNKENKNKGEENEKSND